MLEYVGYSLSDFLLYSPEIYYGLVARYNADMWPLQLVAILLGLLLIWRIWRPDDRHGRLIAAIYALAWSWTAYAFHLERYATIHIAAPYYAALFAIEAGLLLLVGTLWDRMRFAPCHGLSTHIGFIILLFAVLLYPLVGWLAGRQLMEVEFFALMPDPTMMATLGLLLTMTGNVRWLLLVIPVLWTIIAAATAWPMEAYDGLASPILAALTLTLILIQTIRSYWR